MFGAFRWAILPALIKSFVDVEGLYPSTNYCALLTVI
jgi:hypothetical protein